MTPQETATTANFSDLCLEASKDQQTPGESDCCSAAAYYVNSINPQEGICSNCGEACEIVKPE